MRTLGCAGNQLTAFRSPPNSTLSPHALSTTRNIHQVRLSRSESLVRKENTIPFIPFISSLNRLSTLKEHHVTPQKNNSTIQRYSIEAFKPKDHYHVPTVPDHNQTLSGPAARQTLNSVVLKPVSCLLRSSRSVMTLKASRQTRPSSSSSATWPGPTTACRTATRSWESGAGEHWPYRLIRSASSRNLAGQDAVRADGIHTEPFGCSLVAPHGLRSVAVVMLQSR